MKNGMKYGPSHDQKMVAARYAMHRVRVAQYATLALNGTLTDEQARQEYGAAMENYDGIIAQAHHFADGNQADMDKGADAVTEIIEGERERMAAE